tara:strand:- start:565 stop:771 length:207 start_codon:yes stop_codon:yes gene_type:complete
MSIPLDVCLLIRLAEFREQTDSTAAAAFRSAAAEILRLRRRQAEIALERDTIRMQLFELIGIDPESRA